MRKKLYEVGGGNYEVNFGEIRRASYQQVKFSRRSATLLEKFGDLHLLGKLPASYRQVRIEIGKIRHLIFPRIKITEFRHLLVDKSLNNFIESHCPIDSFKNSSKLKVFFGGD